MIEFKHLQVIHTLHSTNSLTKTAKKLNLTQSALSHQIKNLEKNLGIKIWRREGRYLKLNSNGRLILNSAERIIPEIERLESNLKTISEGKKGILRIGVECYPCREWLKVIVKNYLKSSPEIDLDVFEDFRFSGTEALANFNIDLLITPDKVTSSNLLFIKLFNYELLTVVSNTSELRKLNTILPENLSKQTLITFPVPKDRLDVYTKFLYPASIKNLNHRTVSDIDIMLHLVEDNRGVCFLPRWIVNHRSSDLNIKTLRMGEKGVICTLYAAIRVEDQNIDYLKKFIASCSS
jgi:LysR family transcriptional regulator, regulator for metE and metH